MQTVLLAREFGRLMALGWPLQGRR
jgi:hypothetical protein